MRPLGDLGEAGAGLLSRTRWKHWARAWRERDPEGDGDGEDGDGKENANARGECTEGNESRGMKREPRGASAPLIPGDSWMGFESVPNACP